MTIENGEAILRNLMNLEAEICDLSNMATLMVVALDEKIVDEGGVPGQFYIKLSEADMNLIAFAWNDVEARANRLQKQFHAAFK